MDQDPNPQNQPAPTPPPTPVSAPPILPIEYDTLNRTPLLSPLPTPIPETDHFVKPPQSKRPLTRSVVIVITGLMIIGAVAAGAYALGNGHGFSAGKNAQILAQKTAEFKIPANATMVSKCSENEGTQYVLPSNIPQGPIYNMWNNKVTGVEYMLAETDIAAMKTDDLNLMNQKYDHVDVMYEPGHAGFSESHYHLTFSLIPYGEEKKITCGGTPSTMQMN